MSKKLLWMTYFPPEIFKRSDSTNNNLGDYNDMGECLANTVFGLLSLSEEEAQLLEGSIRDRIGDSITYDYQVLGDREIMLTRKHATKPFTITYHLINKDECWSGIYKFYTGGGESEPYEWGYANAIIVDAPECMFKINRS